MDSDFKSPTQSGVSSSTSSAGTPINVTTGATTATTTSTAPTTSSVDGFSGSTQATPSLINSAPMTDVKPEPNPIIASAAAEMNKDSARESLDLSPIKEDPKVESTKEISKPKADRPKKRTGLFLLSLFLTALLSGAAGWFAHAYLNPQKTVAPASKPVATAPVAKALTAEDTVALVAVNTVGKVESPAKMSKPSAPVKTEGFSFYTTPDPADKQYASFSGAEAEFVATSTKIGEILQAKGFTVTPATGDTTKPASTTYTNEKDGVHCRSFVATQDGATGKFLAFNCLNKKDYADASAKLKPLFDLYATTPEGKTATASGTFTLGSLVSKASKTTGYVLANVSSSSQQAGAGSSLHFYQSPDQQWHFFKGAQNMLACADYNTPELKKAYLDEACMTGATQSTIKL